MAAERRARIPDYLGPKEYRPPEALDEMEASGLYTFDEKKDGFWCLATVEDGEIVQMASRTATAFTGAEAGDLLGLRVANTSGGRLVGELTADPVDGEKIGTRRLHLFDALDWNGHDLRVLPQTERREALEMIYGIFPGERARDIVRLVAQRTEGVRAWFDEILARGGEGIVAKKKDALYRARTADGKVEGWTKIKLKRTVDYVVVGHGLAEKGTPVLHLGLYKKGKLTKVCTVILPPHWRKRSPESYVGEVVEAEGWEIFPSGAIRHAQIGHRPGPRTDKLPEQCTHESAMEA